MYAQSRQVEVTYLVRARARARVRVRVRVRVSNPNPGRGDVPEEEAVVAPADALVHIGAVVVRMSS